LGAWAVKRVVAGSAAVVRAAVLAVERVVEDMAVVVGLVA